MLRHTILLFLLVCIFISQLIFTLTSHASVLRCSMCHSLVLAMIALAHIRKSRIRNSLRDSHYHELDVHYPKYMLILGLVCSLVQFLSFKKLDCALTTKKCVDYCKKVLFFLLPSTSVVIIAVLRILANKQVIALADPSLHLLTNILIAWSIYSSLKEHLLILLLAVPKSLDLENIKDSFREKT
uniref:Uncharacterized protein n=1 Tax=Romanomermis culicivorax TaxID=13658 RepID=A0A915K943_ROMCU